MNITPKDAPVYGGGQIIVELYGEPALEEENYYLVFKGSQLRHVTVATSYWNNENFHLRSFIPGHSAAETVDLSVYGISVGVGIRRLASATFQYVSDSAHQMATFLLACVNEPDHLTDLLSCGEQHFQLSQQEQSALDERLTRAFQALQLPEWWNMMGPISEGAEPADRLLHFSARLGLTQLTSHFLTLPGSQAALSALNKDRLLPEDLAREGGHHDLAALLQFYRKQDIVYLPHKSVLEDTEKKCPLIISSDGSRNLEYDILELEKRSLTLSEISSLNYDCENMKELNTTRNGNLHTGLTNRLKGVEMLLNSNRSASLPRQAFRTEVPRQHARVLGTLQSLWEIIAV